jgi:hypothetical protein
MDGLDPPRLLRTARNQRVAPVTHRTPWPAGGPTGDGSKGHSKGARGTLWNHCQKIGGSPRGSGSRWAERSMLGEALGGPQMRAWAPGATPKKTGATFRQPPRSSMAQHSHPQHTPYRKTCVQMPQRQPFTPDNPTSGKCRHPFPLGPTGAVFPARSAPSPPPTKQTRTPFPGASSPTESPLKSGTFDRPPKRGFLLDTSRNWVVEIVKQINT